MHGYWADFCIVDENQNDLGGNLLHGDTHSITPDLWHYLIDRFSPRSILDVGAGEGHALGFFNRNGIVAHGFDGLAQNVQNAKFPMALHDLKSGPYVYPCDLVYCVEVAEHIDEAYLENFLSTLSNAPVVAMTHALPGQNGHHHVNLQPKEYWVAKMEARGYKLSIDNDRFKHIAHMENPDSYFSQSGLVFLQSIKR